MPSRQIVLYIVGALLLAGPTFAQDFSSVSAPGGAVTPGAEVVAEAPDVPSDEFNRGTPRRSFVGFMSAVEAGDQIVGGIREMLASHEHVLQEAPRVRFTRFGDDALILEVFAYLTTNDYATYLEYAEDVNIKILAIVEAAGTQLALPGREMRVEQTNFT